MCDLQATSGRTRTVPGRDPPPAAGSAPAGPL